jgi:hypothetical protein
MFRNPNYKQYKDYVPPYNEDFVCGFIAYLYWVFLYLKLFWLGTDEDRVELAKCYDEAVEKEVTIKDSFYNTNFSHYYRTACDNFLRKVKYEAWEDDEKRNRMIKLAACEKERDELNAKLGNLTKADIKELKRFEEQLDNENIGNDERNEYRIMTINGIPNQHAVPKMHALLTMGIPVIREENMKNLNGDDIHIRIYDKIWGFYTAVVWSDIAPLNEDGSINYKYYYCPTFAPDEKKLAFSSDKGIVKLAREQARMEIARIAINSLRVEK